ASRPPTDQGRMGGDAAYRDATPCPETSPRARASQARPRQGAPVVARWPWRGGRNGRGAAPDSAGAAPLIAADDRGDLILATELGHVLGGRALLALNHVELHALALGEGLEALALDRRMVDEQI